MTHGAIFDSFVNCFFLARSPVFSHLSASLQGLTTIRAFEAQEILQSEFDRYQDVHSTSWYLFIASNRGFGFWLDSFCVVYLAIVCFTILLLGGEFYISSILCPRLGEE